jgi:aldose 1-epimerase
MLLLHLFKIIRDMIQPSHPSHPVRQLQRGAFQGTVNGADVDLFHLSSPNGAFVNVCNYGARVVQMVVPDARGNLGDVALGFEDLAGLMRPAPGGVPSMGAFIGRYANRIAHAQFTLDGICHSLSANSAAHCIHGGQGGSRYAVFKATQTTANQLVLEHTFTPANDGFPGQLKLRLVYTLDASLDNTHALRVEWQAQCVEAPTVASFTSHVFFNLSGDPSTNVAQHRVQLQAQRYLPLQSNQAPTGELLTVAGTPFDFRNVKPVGYDWNNEHPQIALCGGYDHHFEVDGWHGRLQRVATVTEPSSGRTLTVHSTEPGLQLFTANGLDIMACGFGRRSGLCIEPSYFPDSPNQPHFPSTRLNPGQSRTGQIVYALSV